MFILICAFQEMLMFPICYHNSDQENFKCGDELLVFHLARSVLHTFCFLSGFLPCLGGLGCSVVLGREVC